MRLKLSYVVVSEWNYGPLETLRHAKLAEEAGFDGVFVSDHFHPFQDVGMNAPFSWVWLASTAERTKSIRLGTEVTSPILRYNPAVVAQAFATLGVMYPGRVFLTLAAGESLNESPCGYSWPSPGEGVARVRESIQIITKLWTGGFVSFEGKRLAVKNAKLYTKPEKRVPLYLAFDGPRIAELAGKYADGFRTPQPMRTPRSSSATSISCFPR